MSRHYIFRIPACRAWFLISLLCSASLVAQDAEPDLSELATTDLIDRLVSVDEFGVGFHPTAWSSGFMATDDEPRFLGGILGSQEPQVDPIMKELVSRGCAAMPDLLAKLGDGRPTKMIIEGGRGFGAVWHGDEYSHRYRDPAKHYKGVNSIDGHQPPLGDEDYVLRVGDLCYVLIGQIVNRPLDAIRYQPTACLVINSPVTTPSLAAATRQDWTGLTPEQHEKSLLADTKLRGSYKVGPAMTRLAFYYPETAEALARNLLHRKLYDSGVVFDFIRDALIPAPQEKWKPMIDTFRDTYGAGVADSIPYFIYAHYGDDDGSTREEWRQARKAALTIMATLYPDYDVKNPPAFDAAKLDEQIAVIRAVRHLNSQALTDAAHQVFLDALDAKIAIDDELAILNLRRLESTDKRRAYSEFFELRIGEFEKKHAAAEVEEHRLYYEAQIAEYRRILASTRE